MVSTFVILFSIASLVAIVARRAKLPYTIALVIVGVAVGAFHVLDTPHLTKELLFSLFLPGLVFEAAYNIHAHELGRKWRTIAALAGPGVILAIVLTTVILTSLLRLFGLHPHLPWQEVMVFAALVAATDPIAVVGVFRQIGVPAKLTTMLEAESLFNDGTAIVVLSLVLAYVTGEQAGIGTLSIEFLKIVAGGVALGGALGYAVTRMSRRIDDAMVEITLTTIAAYGSFVLAERFHLSGLLATVTAGLVLGTYGREAGMSKATTQSVDVFWEYVAFALNSIVFLLIGFEVSALDVFSSAPTILLAFLAMTSARFIVVFLVVGTFCRSAERISAKWATVLAWGGLRGALSMVLALSIPQNFPDRVLIIDMTFGVVLTSLLFQGLTMKAVAARLSASGSRSKSSSEP